MAAEHREFRPVRPDDDMIDRVPGERPAESKSLGSLLKELASETGQLVRDEMTLARNELRQTAKDVLTDSVWVAVGIGLAVAGGLALLAGIIVLLGDVVFGANYWLPALIVGALMVLIGGIMAYSKGRDIASDVEMDATAESLRTDAKWAKAEAREFGEELRQGPDRRHAA